MAISGPTVNTSKTGGYNPASIVSNSLTGIAEGDVYLLETLQCGSLYTMNAPSYSGTGLTITEIGSALDFVTTRRLQVFHCVAGASPTAGTITCTWATSPAHYAVMRVMKYTGVDTTGPVINIVDATGVGTAPAVTLGAFGSANNWTIAVVAYVDNTLTFAAGTGFTEEDAEEPTESFGGAVSVLASEYQAANDTSVTGTISSSVDWAIKGFELVAATAGGAGPIDLRKMIGPGGLIGPQGSFIS